MHSDRQTASGVERQGKHLDPFKVADKKGLEKAAVILLETTAIKDKPF